MKILFIVPYVPSLVRVRPFNLIRFLTARGHQVTVFTLWTNEQERADVEKLRAECHEIRSFYMPGWKSLINCLIAIPTNKPLQSVFSWHPNLAEHLVKFIIQSNDNETDFDIIHIEHLRGSRYGTYLQSQLLKSGKRQPIVWDSVDCISHLFRLSKKRSKTLSKRLLTGFELGRTEKVERELLQSFDQTLVTSKVDKAAMLSLLPDRVGKTNISVVPNGVDIDFFHPDEQIPKEPATLIVSGKMSYHANVSMVMYLVKEIMPGIWAQRPDVKLTILGKSPTRAIQSLSENPAITVTGTVPDMRPYLQQATLAVVPLTYGAGIQNKVLEAMACGTPVVSTPQAISAINVHNGQHLIVAQTHTEFATAVLQLLANPQKQREIAQAGLSYVRENHRWVNIVAHLEQVYNKAIQHTLSIKV